MIPGNRQKASLSSFLWFLSFYRGPLLGSLGLDHEQSTGRRCLFFQMHGTFPKPMVVSSLLTAAARLSSCPPTWVGTTTGGHFLPRSTACGFFYDRRLDEILETQVGDLGDLNESDCLLLCWGVLQPVFAARQDGLLGVLPDANHQWEAKFVTVGFVQAAK